MGKVGHNRTIGSDQKSNAAMNSVARLGDLSWSEYSRSLVFRQFQRAGEDIKMVLGEIV